MLGDKSQWVCHHKQPLSLNILAGPAAGQVKWWIWSVLALNSAHQLGLLRAFNLSLTVENCVSFFALGHTWGHAHLSIISPLECMWSTSGGDYRCTSFPVHSKHESNATLPAQFSFQIISIVCNGIHFSRWMLQLVKATVGPCFYLTCLYQDGWASSTPVIHNQH